MFAALIVFPVIWIIRFSKAKLIKAVYMDIMFCFTRKRAKHATKKWKSLRKHGYWWMILLLYSHVLHTSMSILNCPMIPDSTGNIAPVSTIQTY